MESGGSRTTKGSNSEAEPHPDVHSLFSHYNALYFDDTLGACIVSWTDSRTVRNAGMCYCLEDGGCEIRLSKPLLKSCSIANLKNILLHEMIHAFLYFRENKRDHSYHGPSFASKVNAINSSSVKDPQRPSDGYDIKISHDRGKEDGSHKAETWTGTSGSTNDRSVNREPAAKICILNVDHDEFCNKLSCHSQKMLCSGRYRKTTEVLEYEQAKVAKDARKTGDKFERSAYITRRTKQRLQNDEQRMETSKDQKPDHINKQSMKAVILKKEGDVFPAKIPKGPSSLRSRKKHCNDLAERKVLVGEKTLGKCKRQEIVQSHWCAYYADEELDEHVEPLVNKRTERRKREKAIFMSRTNFHRC